MKECNYELRRLHSLLKHTVRVKWVRHKFISQYENWNFN